MATLPVRSPHIRPARRADEPAAIPAHLAELAWVGIAAVAGFAVSAILVGWLELARSWFVLGYAVVAVPLLAAYVRWSGIDVAALVRRRWALGLLAGALVGGLLVVSVLKQDASPRGEGATLAFRLVWWGVVYGTLDALLLNVLPVLATWRALVPQSGSATWRRKIGAGALALLASVLVTAAYHAGFPEYRGAEIAKPLAGDVLSLAYLLTANPLTAVIGHVAMHVAAVLHGAAEVTQLPPH